MLESQEILGQEDTVRTFVEISMGGDLGPTVVVISTDSPDVFIFQLPFSLDPLQLSEAMTRT